LSRRRHHHHVPDLPGCVSSVKKNVTIPVWLNVAAEKAGLNFSKILQAGLKASLRVQ